MRCSVGFCEFLKNFKRGPVLPSLSHSEGYTFRRFLPPRDRNYTTAKKQSVSQSVLSSVCLRLLLEAEGSLDRILVRPLWNFQDTHRKKGDVQGESSFSQETTAPDAVNVDGHSTILSRLSLIKEQFFPSFLSKSPFLLTDDYRRCGIRCEIGSPESR